ncbi:MAG: hypothetical protein HFK10_01060 [Clostridia bacterium]|jgi:DNA polymerase III epsilon subunit-like protein|nr:hypothetical protein [Clostridia bacterium]
MRQYKNIVSLDFELFNSYLYWSICWSGAVSADLGLRETARYTRLYNPVTRRKNTGSKIKFPFTFDDLKKEPTFGGAGRELFKLLEEDTLVVGHAIDNDVRMIIEACHHYKLPMPTFDFLDTVVVYSAVTGTQEARSLSHLAEQFGFEFEAHDPTEDAAATLEVLRRLLQQADCGLADLEEKFGFHFGRLEKGMMRRCYIESVSHKALKHIENQNALFDTVVKFDGNVEPKPGYNNRTFCFAGSLSADQDVSRVAERLLRAGGRITGCLHAADKTVTTCIDEYEMAGQTDAIFFKTLVTDLGMTADDCDGLDFKPTKITALSGVNISYEEYLKKRYPTAADGDMKGERFVFNSSADRLYIYEQLYREITSRGGSVTPRVRGARYFVLNTPEQIDDTHDLRILALHSRAGRGVRTINVAELITLLASPYERPAQPLPPVGDAPRKKRRRRRPSKAKQGDAENAVAAQHENAN